MRDNMTTNEPTTVALKSFRCRRWRRRRRSENNNHRPSSSSLWRKCPRRSASEKGKFRRRWNVSLEIVNLSRKLWLDGLSSFSPALQLSPQLQLRRLMEKDEEKRTRKSFSSQTPFTTDQTKGDLKSFDRVLTTVTLRGWRRKRASRRKSFKVSLTWNWNG